MRPHAAAGRKSVPNYVIITYRCALFVLLHITITLLVGDIKPSSVFEGELFSRKAINHHNNKLNLLHVCSKL